MARCIHVEPVEDVPEDASVFHYDELTEELKIRFPALVDDSPNNEQCLRTDQLSSGDCVKFTEYYRITYR